MNTRICLASVLLWCVPWAFADAPMDGTAPPAAALPVASLVHLGYGPANDAVVLRIGNDQWPVSRFRWLIEAEEASNVDSEEVLRAQVWHIADSRLLAEQAEAAGLAAAPLIAERLALARDRVLAEAEWERLLKAAPVNAADVRAAFDAQPDALDELQLSQILVCVDAGKSPHASQRTDAEALKRIESIRRELESGANFAALARKYSDDVESRGDGGVLPPVHREDLKPSIAPAVRSLHRNEVSAPVRSNEGYHLIRLDDQTMASFEGKRSLLEFNLRHAWAERQIDELRAAAGVTFDPSIWLAEREHFIPHR